MTPYYSRNGITIFCDDCLEVMPQLSGIDSVITDPPYGLGENQKKVLSRQQLAQPIDYGDFNWDDKPATQQQIDMILRCSKNQVIFGGNYFCLPPSSSWIVWDKVNSGDFADAELAWTSHKRAVRIFRYMWNGMIKQKPEKRFHPTQKPLALMEWIIENYTEKTDLILDPFMGSGTTLVAAQNTNRRAVGIELNEDYCKIATERLRQPSFFSLPTLQPSIKPEQLNLMEG